MQKIKFSILALIFLVSCGDSSPNMDSSANSNSGDTSELFIDSVELQNENAESIYQELIGNEFVSLTEFEQLKSFEDIGGSIIGDYKSEYCVSIYTNDSVDLVAFEKIVERINGKPKFILLDIKEIIRINESQEICHGNMGCRLDGKFDPELIAVYISQEDINTEFFTNIKEVWRANRETEKLEKIETNGIDCANPLFGAEY